MKPKKVINPIWGEVHNVITYDPIGASYQFPVRTGGFSKGRLVYRDCPGFSSGFFIDSIEHVGGPPNVNMQFESKTTGSGVVRKLTGINIDKLPDFSQSRTKRCKCKFPRLVWIYDYREEPKLCYDSCLKCGGLVKEGEDRLNET